MPAGQQVNNQPGAMGHMHTQLTKSLERILEEAHLSGELKLSGRKLKDFPKTGGKYDLSDTVIAGKFSFIIIRLYSLSLFTARNSLFY